MQTLIYLHGFLSSPGSIKAQQTKIWLHRHRPEINYLCPSLSPYPEETQQQLDQLVTRLDVESRSVGLVGSSLGGFWATYLVETYGMKAVVINPSVRPYDMVNELLGQTLKNFYSGDEYQMQPQHADFFKSVDFPTLEARENYWLLAQTGDEVLDYRLAEAKYQGCEITIEQGGDHSFQGYKKKLPEVIQFLFPI